MYNYHLAMLPREYRKVSTFSKWYRQYSYTSLYKMQAKER